MIKNDENDSTHKSEINATTTFTQSWALAKESGHFDSILRYPAEDRRYEKDKMDNLGFLKK